MPRAEPTRHDDTALTFLDAAAQLIDAALAESGRDQPSRLRSIKFPPALDWIRIEDVLTVARTRGGGPTSKKAFTNRWPSKDEFVRDAIVHCMLYRDQPAIDPTYSSAAALLGSLHADPDESFCGTVRGVADSLYVGLVQHPRSFLLAHIGPMLSHHPDLQEQVLTVGREAMAVWAQAYAGALRDTGLNFRPGWTLERVCLALQAILDGFVLRYRVDPQSMVAARWGASSLFADTVLSFIAGTVDLGSTGMSTQRWLDQQVRLSPADRARERQVPRLTP